MYRNGEGKTNQNQNEPLFLKRYGETNQPAAQPQQEINYFKYKTFLSRLSYSFS